MYQRYKRKLIISAYFLFFYQYEAIISALSPRNIILRCLWYICCYYNFLAVRAPSTPLFLVHKRYEYSRPTSTTPNIYTHSNIVHTLAERNRKAFQPSHICVYTYTYFTQAMVIHLLP